VTSEISRAWRSAGNEKELPAKGRILWGGQRGVVYSLDFRIFGAGMANLSSEAKPKRDLTTGSITRSIFYLALPVVATMFLETAFSIADIFWVGKLGAVSLAAVISSAFLIWMIYSLVGAVSIGVTALVARFIGAKRPDEAAFSARQAYLFSILFALCLTVPGVLFTKWAFVLMGTAPEVTHLGIRYLRIIFAGAITFFIIDVFSALFRASGDTKTPMLVIGGSLALNIILYPLLIFGWGPFPRLETDGAALASVFSQGIGSLLFVFLIIRGKLACRFSLLPKWDLDFSMVWRILRIGIPASSAWILFSVVYLFINKIVALFGTEAIAALGIGNRMESISFLTCIGFSTAASTLVGQNLGAGKPERSAQAARQTAGITVMVTGLVALTFFAFPRQIASFFISDPRVVEIAIGYLRILALSQMFMALEIVFEGGFAGAGNTVPPMIVSIAGSAARIPLAYLLAVHWGIGINGVWLAITSTTIVKGVVLSFWFRRGRWKTKRI
jgi:putative MATE family efflux protein